MDRSTLTLWIVWNFVMRLDDEIKDLRLRMRELEEQCSCLASGGHFPRSADAVELEWVIQTLRANGGNRAEAARQLGISPRTLRNKISKIREMERRI